MKAAYRSPDGKEPIEVPGEDIFELFTRADGLPLGSAKAIVDHSIPHYHEKTHELYIVTKGSGKVLLQNPDGGLRIYVVVEGGVLYIPPGTKHAARGLKVGGKVVPFEVNVVSCPPWTKEDHHTIELEWPANEKEYIHAKHEQQRIV